VTLDPPANPAVIPPQGRVPTDFDWLIYADATFAGLSLLLPIPVVDSILEEYFRRRMPRDIARRRARALPSASIAAVNRTRSAWWPGCLAWPVRAVVYLIRNLWRTLVYVLTVYDASEKLSYYWHRAFLLDYMILRGDLDKPARATVAAVALHRVLETTQTSPLRNLAGELVEQARTRVGALARAIFRGARQQDTEESRRAKGTLAAHWNEFRDYLLELAGRYDAAFATAEHEQAAAAAARAERG